MTGTIQKEKRKLVWRAHHESVQAYMGLKPKSHEQETVHNRCVYDGSRPWAYGSAGNLAGLNRRLTEGWPEGVEKLAELKDGGLMPPQKIKRTRTRREFGAEVDVTEYWRGRGDRAWSDCVRAQRQGPQNVRIVPMIAGSCQQTEAQFFYRGAAVARLADILAQAGYNVEIVAACVAERAVIGSQGKASYCHTVTLKQATAPLDLSNIASVLCQPGFVRHYMFRSFTASPGDFVCDSMFGWYGDEAELDRLARSAHLDPGAVRQFFMRYSIDSADKANQWIADCVSALNERMEEAA